MVAATRVNSLSIPVLWLKGQLSTQKGGRTVWKKRLPGTRGEKRKDLKPPTQLW